MQPNFDAGCGYIDDSPMCVCVCNCMVGKFVSLVWFGFVGLVCQCLWLYKTNITVYSTNLNKIDWLGAANLAIELNILAQPHCTHVRTPVSVLHLQLKIAKWANMKMRSKCFDAVTAERQGTIPSLLVRFIDAIEWLCEWFEKSMATMKLEHLLRPTHTHTHATTPLCIHYEGVRDR